MIFCTAGHVDHGKTALVRALTGVDTDRLAEERRRGLTIELGFAPLELPGVGRVSLVDVPGHAQFIPTMLSGCGGLDGALFTVAADEGPMPQTAEHLDILSLLGLERGVVALTRADLASPAARAEAEARTRALTAGTFLEGAPRIFVSAVTGEGLEALRAALAAMARQRRPAGGQPPAPRGPGLLRGRQRHGGHRHPHRRPLRRGQGAALSGRADCPGAGSPVPRRPGGGAARRGAGGGEPGGSAPAGRGPGTPWPPPAPSPSPTGPTCPWGCSPAPPFPCTPEVSSTSTTAPAPWCAAASSWDRTCSAPARRGGPSSASPSPSPPPPATGLWRASSPPWPLWEAACWWIWRPGRAACGRSGWPGWPPWRRAAPPGGGIPATPAAPAAPAPSAEAEGELEALYLGYGLEPPLGAGGAPLCRADQEARRACRRLKERGPAGALHRPSAPRRGRPGGGGPAARALRPRLLLPGRGQGRPGLLPPVRPAPAGALGRPGVTRRQGEVRIFSTSA